ncbi:MAG: transposase [Pseudomonadota bacterium]
MGRDTRSMPNYRRRLTPGGTYFFSVMLSEGAEISLLTYLDRLRHAYARTHAEQPFRTDAIVVLPDHLHCVWTLPLGDADYALRWRKIKSRFTREIGIAPARSRSEALRTERGIWQRRFWEREIHDDADYALHIAYTLTDPVRHGLVAEPQDWTASSIHRDLRDGCPPPDLPETPDPAAFGERGVRPIAEPA